MKKSAVFYGVVVAATFLLIGIAWYFQKLIQGFTNPAHKALSDAFQDMSPDRKKVVCQTLTDQMASFSEFKTKTTPDQLTQLNETIATVQSQIDALGCASLT